MELSRTLGMWALDLLLFVFLFFVSAWLIDNFLKGKRGKLAYSDPDHDLVVGFGAAVLGHVFTRIILSLISLE